MTQCLSLFALLLWLLPAPALAQSFMLSCSPGEPACNMDIFKNCLRLEVTKHCADTATRDNCLMENDELIRRTCVCASLLSDGDKQAACGKPAAVKKAAPASGKGRNCGGFTDQSCNEQGYNACVQATTKEMCRGMQKCPKIPIVQTVCACDNMQDKTQDERCAAISLDQLNAKLAERRKAEDEQKNRKR